VNSTPDDPQGSPPPEGEQPEPLKPYVPPREPYVPPQDPRVPPPAMSPAPHEPPAAPAKPEGPGVAAGVGTGCAVHILGVALIFLTSLAMYGVWGILGPFILIAVVAGLLMIWPNLRRFAAGMLIVVAAAWITVLGPCVALLTGFSL
jgi:hypothetical protein